MPPKTATASANARVKKEPIVAAEGDGRGGEGSGAGWLGRKRRRALSLGTSRLGATKACSNSNRKFARKESDLEKMMRLPALESSMSGWRGGKTCEVCKAPFGGGVVVPAIHRHVKAKHKLTVLQYFAMFCPDGVPSQGCLYRCFYCKNNVYVTKASAQLRRHIKNHHPKKSAEIHSKEFFSLGARYVESRIACPRCKSSLLHTYQSLHGHAKSHGVHLSVLVDDIKEALKKTSAIISSRRSENSEKKHTCARCDTDYAECGSLLRHLKKFHKQTGPVQGDEDLRHLSNDDRFNKYGRCRICNINMVNTRPTLKLHLQTRHSKTLEDYLREVESPLDEDRTGQQQNRKAVMVDKEKQEPAAKKPRKDASDGASESREDGSGDSSWHRVYIIDDQGERPTEEGSNDEEEEEEGIEVDSVMEEEVEGEEEEDGRKFKVSNDCRWQCLQETCTRCFSHFCYDINFINVHFL